MGNPRALPLCMKPRLRSGMKTSATGNQQYSGTGPQYMLSLEPNIITGAYNIMVW